MNNWHNMAYSQPEPDALIEFKSGGTGYARNINPAANAHSIEWRYTGIAREFGYGAPYNASSQQKASNALSGEALGYAGGFYNLLGDSRREYEG